MKKLWIILMFLPMLAASQCIDGKWDPTYTWVKDCTGPYDGLFNSGTPAASYSGTTTIYAGTTPHTLSWKLHYFKGNLTGSLSGAKLPLILGLHPWNDGVTVPNLLNIESDLLGYEGSWEDVIVMTVALENGNNLGTWWDGTKVNGVPTNWAMDGIITVLKARLLDATSLLTTGGAIGISSKAVDTDRVYLAGTSMGGSGTYHIGIRHPEIFAAVHANAGFADYEGGPCGNENFCTVFYSDFIGTTAENLQMKGLDNVNYPAHSYSDMSWFVGTHNGASWSAVNGGKKYEPPYIMMTHGKGDVTVDISSANRLYTALKAKKFGVSYNRHTGGHSGENYMHIDWMLGFRKNQSYVALSSNSTDVTTGTEHYNYLDKIGWLQSSIVDQTGTYAIKLYGTGTTSVTPRRLQAFVVTANKAFHYWVGTVTGNGTAVTADATGLLTIPSVTVASTGTLLTIQADGTPPPDPVPTVTLSASPTSITTGLASTLTWSSTNATGCTGSGAWSGAKATSGSQSTAALSSTSTYTLTCTGPGGSGNQSVTVTVTASVPPVNSPIGFLVPNLNPTSNTVAVSTTSALVSALAAAPSGRTILLADGTYDLVSVLPLRFQVANVTLFGASKDASKVILRGGGFGSSNTNEELIKIEASNITLAYFTLRDGRANGLKIQNGGSNNLLVHGVNFIDICERSIKAPDQAVSYNGEIRYCLFEQVTPITSAIPSLNDNGNYIAGMDMMKIEGWRIHDNVFKNIRGQTGGGRAAIFVWNVTKKLVIENNAIIGCDRSIAMGNPLNTEVGSDSTIVRNNYINSGVGISIELCNSKGVKILNNTIMRKDSSFNRTLQWVNNTTGNVFKGNSVSGKMLTISGTIPDTVGNFWWSDAGNKGFVPSLDSALTQIINIHDTVSVRYDSLIYVPVRHDSLIYVPTRYDSLIYINVPVRYDSLIYVPTRYDSLIYVPVRHDSLIYVPVVHDSLIYVPVRHDSLIYVPTRYDSLIYIDRPVYTIPHSFKMEIVP